MSRDLAADRLAGRLLVSPLHGAGALQTLALEQSDVAVQPTARPPEYWLRVRRALAAYADKTVSSAMSADHEADWETENRLPRIYVKLHAISRQRN